jgi:hypothetical protein
MWSQCHVGEDLGAVLPAGATGFGIGNDSWLVGGFAYHHITLAMNGDASPTADTQSVFLLQMNNPTFLAMALSHGLQQALMLGDPVTRNAG